jgi:hypothetical protein
MRGQPTEPWASGPPDDPYEMAAGRREYERELKRKFIRTSYEVITPESSERGEPAEQGWEDEEGVNVRSMKGAIDFLKEHGPLECETTSRSAGYRSRFELRCHTLDPERDMYSGEEKYYTYFVEGFNSKEVDKIFDKVDFSTQQKRR